MNVTLNCDFNRFVPLGFSCPEAGIKYLVKKEETNIPSKDEGIIKFVFNGASKLERIETTIRVDFI